MKAQSILLGGDREPLVEHVLGVILAFELRQPIVVVPEHIAHALVTEAVVSILSQFWRQRTAS